MSSVPDAPAGSPPAPHPVELAGLLQELTALIITADGMPEAMERLAGFTVASV